MDNLDITDPQLSPNPDSELQMANVKRRLFEQSYHDIGVDSRTNANGYKRTQSYSQYLLISYYTTCHVSHMMYHHLQICAIMNYYPG